MTLTEFDTARSRWALMQPGLEALDAEVIGEVRSLFALIDARDCENAAMMALLARVAAGDPPPPGGWRVAAAAWLAQHGAVNF